VITFAAAVLSLLALAAVLSWRLSRGTKRDSLGLRAARRAVIAESRHLVAQDRNRDLVRRRARARWKTDRFVEHYSSRAGLAAITLTIPTSGRYAVHFPALRQTRRSDR
jgi:hypothetical protein